MRRTMIFAAAVLALAACNQADGPAANGTAGGSPATPPDMTITTNEGVAEVRNTGDVAANMPPGLPPYPGAQAAGGVQISTRSRDGGQGMIAGFRTSDAPAQVIEFYAAAAERAGYRIEGRMTIGANATLMASRDGGVGFYLTAAQTGEGTMVQFIGGTGRPGR